MVAIWQVAMLYNRRLMHSDAAGMATDIPTVRRVAATNVNSMNTTLERTVLSQISHHTGARSTALPFQTIALIDWLRHPTAVQIMKRQVPEFKASRCHGRGMRTKNALRNPKMGKTGYVGSMTPGQMIVNRMEEVPKSFEGGPLGQPTTLYELSWLQQCGVRTMGGLDLCSNFRE